MTQVNPSSQNHTISALILAAGKGTRMKSALPKVLHPVMGRPMLAWIMDVVKKAGATDVTVVLSPDTTQFAKFLEAHPTLRVATQNSQRGTGDAVAAAAKAYRKAAQPSWSDGSLMRGDASSAEWILICAGDTPAINPQTIRDFIKASIASSRKLAVLGMNVSDPRGYGRLIKASDGGLKQVIEDRDADPQTKKIMLCNSGVIFAEVSWLFKMLDSLVPNNSQNEYYLTDVFAASEKQGHAAFVFESSSEAEFSGVNDRIQLERIERSMIKQRINEFLSHGVTFHLPETTYIEADVVIEPDTRIFSGVTLKGKTKIARNCIIGPGAHIEDTVLGAGVRVGAHAVLIGCQVSAGEVISPQASCTDLKV